MKKAKGFKQPVAKQLPSGSWFCRVRVNGQDVAITRDTEKEAVAEAMAVKYGIIGAKVKEDAKKKTLTAAIDEYIEVRENILSPSTIRGYRIIQNNRFQSMMNKDIFSVTQEQWQRAVNLESKRLNAKTLTNSWRFLASVICETTGDQIKIRLPQIVANERPWLTPDQVVVFVDEVKGSTVEIPALLALSSLRCSELLNLRWKDIDLEKGVLKVNGSAVCDEEGNLIRRQETKNKTSRRLVPIIPPLKEALTRVDYKGEYVVSMTANGIYKHINRICAENGLPEVGIHGLRHSFASLAFNLGMPEKVAMQIGGWANDQTMRKIYTHISEEQITAISQDFVNFFSPRTKNGNENGNEK